MRIGISALQLTASNSGIGRYIENMVSNILLISAQDYYIYVSRGNIREEWLQDKVNLPIKELHFKKEHVIRRNIYEMFFFGRDLRRDDVAVFWSPDTKVPLFMPGNIPFVVTVHDLAIYREAQTYKLSRVVYWRNLFKRSIQRASRVVAISKATRDDILALMDIPAEKIKVIHNGVSSRFRPIDEEESLDAVRKKYSLPRKYILFVGTFSPRKNIAGILESLSILRNAYGVSYRLVMVGEKGWRYQGDLSLVHSLGLDNEVLFPGFVQDPDLPAVYNMADALVFPSLYEGFGLPVLEAMACGTPVVTSNVSALPEVAGAAALLVEPRDSQDIAAGLHKVLTDPVLRGRLIKAGLERSREFTWENAASALNALLVEVAERKQQFQVGITR